MDITNGLTYVSVLYDAGEYIRRGVSAPGLDNTQWAERFRELGGVSAHVRASWQTGQVGRVAIDVAGTAAAVEFVQACCA